MTFDRNAKHENDFIEAMAAEVSASYRETAPEILELLGVKPPLVFTAADVLDVLQLITSARAGGVKCLYCNAVINSVEGSRADVEAHAAVCTIHPMRAMEKEMERLRQAHAALTEQTTAALANAEAALQRVTAERDDALASRGALVTEIARLRGGTFDDPTAAKVADLELRLREPDEHTAPKWAPNPSTSDPFAASEENP